MCSHCGAATVPVGLAQWDYQTLFEQCTKCENRDHVHQRYEYLWHVAEPFVRRARARL